MVGQKGGQEAEIFFIETDEYYFFDFGGTGKIINDCT